jgi:hypothetical protein
MKRIVQACDAIDSLMYAAQPFNNVSFVIASCCHIKGESFGM